MLCIICSLCIKAISERLNTNVGLLCMYFYLIHFSHYVLSVKKGNVRPRSGHEGLEGE
jgi:DMSO/TMAO reductase YedYZ heme-binding membrane subunit